MRGLRLTKNGHVYLILLPENKHTTRPVARGTARSEREPGARSSETHGGGGEGSFMMVEVVAVVTLEPVLPPDNLAMDEGQFRTGFLPSVSLGHHHICRLIHWQHFMHQVIC